MPIERRRPRWSMPKPAHHDLGQDSWPGASHGDTRRALAVSRILLKVPRSCWFASRPDASGPQRGGRRKKRAAEAATSSIAWRSRPAMMETASTGSHEEVHTSLPVHAHRHALGALDTGQTNPPELAGGIVLGDETVSPVVLPAGAGVYRRSPEVRGSTIEEAENHRVAGRIHGQVMHYTARRPRGGLVFNARDPPYPALRVHLANVDPPPSSRVALIPLKASLTHPGVPPRPPRRARGLPRLASAPARGM